MKKKKKKTLLNNAIIAVDANILLNLYRYSPETRERFLKILDNNKDNIWLPYQAAKEFLKNRVNIIKEQKVKCSETLKKLQGILGDFKTKRSPFISKETEKELEKIIIKIEEELKKVKKNIIQ